uniref:Cytochrome b561 domain-containing protein n=1 Tax=Chromera velia CCMP2878 TaxID=1169474 RepID=A0A0G4GR05_9ALVE|mmetsp:Transcript_41125/g.81110  ORF Transcript_41125/g.81110 Transcript_41125/m.81110 type:complete len:227 (+) Transcript_41125:190-870(+)|eukprot:Cvel_5059.t1-p1 / transcript=Cvel_5059.t1 / gene=Cvel_5059 / organism=Chromera_velia_CCMP2878 / gene_product=Probable transmembrane ascorbate ferrireductase 2, putative / transcript_product=Probable transmembrane ascorbate ferrireductase 2, putative / location=Cvel_scaffold230:80200-83930(-) / protein_length=226 / sequence_SO=supercontig / SO=protein_coding / is_pseudo=false
MGALSLSNLLAHFSVFLIFVMTLVWTFGYKELGGLGSKAGKLFNWHPVLMVLGFVVFMGEAMIAFRSSELQRNSRKTLHGVLNTLGFISALCGIIVVFKFHSDMGFPDFYSAHSYAGILVFVVAGIQQMIGTVFFGLSLVPDSWKRAALPWHKHLGKWIFVAAIATIATGIMEKQSFIDVPKFEPVKVFANVWILTLLIGAFFIMGPMEDTGMKESNDASVPLQSA